jgi:hypothetical protein
MLNVVSLPQIDFPKGFLRETATARSAAHTRLERVCPKTPLTNSTGNLPIWTIG